MFKINLLLISQTTSTLKIINILQVFTLLQPGILTNPLHSQQRQTLTLLVHQQTGLKLQELYKMYQLVLILLNLSMILMVVILYLPSLVYRYVDLHLFLYLHLSLYCFTAIYRLVCRYYFHFEHMRFSFLEITDLNMSF